ATRSLANAATAESRTAREVKIRQIILAARRIPFVTGRAVVASQTLREECAMTLPAFCGLLAAASESDSAWSLFQHSSLIYWTAIALICIVPSTAHYWWKIRKAELEAALKQEMIQKGMAADDIQKVLDAGKKGKCD